jgi:hypothetical protein
VRPTTRETLIQARALIADRRHWTRDVTARDRHHRPISATDPSARRWCPIGAVVHVADLHGLPFVEPFLLLEAAALELYGVHVSAVNDLPGRFGHRAVLGAFDLAIARVTEPEGDAGGCSGRISVTRDRWPPGPCRHRPEPAAAAECDPSPGA